jgi:hypothetical protein
MTNLIFGTEDFNEGVEHVALPAEAVSHRGVGRQLGGWPSWLPDTLFSALSQQGAGMPDGDVC